MNHSHVLNLQSPNIKGGTWQAFVLFNTTIVFEDETTQKHVHPSFFHIERSPLFWQDGGILNSWYRWSLKSISNQETVWLDPWYDYDEWGEV